MSAYVCDPIRYVQNHLIHILGGLDKHVVALLINFHDLAFL